MLVWIRIHNYSFKTKIQNIFLYFKSKLSVYKNIKNTLTFNLTYFISFNVHTDDDDDVDDEQTVLLCCWSCCFIYKKIFLSSLQILQIFEYTVFRRQTLWVFPLQKSSMHNALAPQYIKYVFISMRTTIKTTFFSLSLFYLNFQETTQSFKYNKYWICIFILKFQKKFSLEKTFERI